MRSFKRTFKNSALLIFLVIIIQLAAINIFALYFNCLGIFYCSVPVLVMVLGMQYLLNDSSFESTEANKDK
jgi:hypothetical protein